MPASTWLFQTNPNLFNIDDFLKANPNETSWLATQHGTEIKVDDVVFLWRAIGKGKNGTKSGLFAKAHVSEEEQTRSEDPNEKQFWVSQPQRTNYRFSLDQASRLNDMWEQRKR